MSSILTLPQARRIALEAQGLARVRPINGVTTREMGRTLARLQLLQIDSVNVLSRSHYLPLFARLGSYDGTLLDRFSGKSPRRLVEYWAHEASFVLPELFPYLVAVQRRRWASASSLPVDVKESLAHRILNLLESSRPLTAGQVQDQLGHEEERSTEQWGWNWSSVKRVLEDLFQHGLISSAGRTAQFERRYALTRKVMPDPSLAGREVPPAEAYLFLTERSAAALGIGTTRCLADYFRIPVKAAAFAIQTLVQRGTLVPVSVEHWKQPAYRYAGSVLPRAAAGRALLSPFDSLVFERQRLHSLFDFHYRIEIYTPAEKRKYGYYVLPFLLRDRMVARVDLKADRVQGRLMVRGAYAEDCAPADTAVELAEELVLMAGWLGLDHVVVQPRGGLAQPLATALAREYGWELNRETARLSRRLTTPESGVPRLGANTSAITS
ncbi:winged helix-turn-helix domain-containing protein [Arthrobacter sp. JZ12]|uniref:winged helix-turn-helix domain-containing protein n=1 Tax=Arthrobacter sp. JZ12 TaxID=2654190 RepID=UPI002B488BB9|nr:crosslink repair DNA glycosylase YcaQ family protein [Arthrobacter sp. JZ12]WRH25407.1 winged helix-turn-helix domain-containing protein [Arthrobacter sp. JZ12]